MQQRFKPIGFFDSGVGGLSVLRTACRLMGKENYIYYGDGAHAPYGNKDEALIKELALKGVGELLKRDIKALVIACNTATAVAVEHIRQRVDIPVIGMEPAVKPAICYADQGRVLVMATQATLQLPKFGQLVMKLHAKDEIIPLPAVELAALVEKGDRQAVEVYLSGLLAPYVGQVSAVVLGCTHYVFCKEIISRTMNVPVLDGNEGTVLHLKNILAAQDLLNTEGGQITFMASDSALLERKYKAVFTREEWK